MVSAALSAQAKPTPGKRVIWYKSKDGHSVPVTWKESRDPQPGEMDQIASRVESRLATGWRPEGSQPVQKYVDPVALYKQSIGQVAPSSVMTGAAAGMAGGTRQPIDQRNVTQARKSATPGGNILGAGGGDGGTVASMNRKAGEMTRDPKQLVNEVNKFTDDVSKVTGGISQAISPYDPTAKMRGEMVGGLVTGSIDAGADAANFLQTGELEALANVLLKTGAIFIPAGKVAKAGAKAFAGTKAGIRLNTALAMEQAIRAGIPKAQAKAAISKAFKLVEDNAKKVEFDISPSKVDQVGGVNEKVSAPQETIYYRGVNPKGGAGSLALGKGKYVTSQKQFAESYMGNGGSLESYTLSPKAKILDFEDSVYDQLFRKHHNPNDPSAMNQAIADEARSMGYDGISMGDAMTSVWNESVLVPKTAQKAPVKEPFTTPVETPKGRVKGTPKSNTQLASAIRELDPFDDTGYELLDAAHRRLKGSPLPKIDDPSEFARLRDSLADEIDADSLKLEGQRMEIDARKQEGKNVAEWFKNEKWGAAKDEADPFVTVRVDKHGAHVEGRRVPMVSLERFEGGGENIAADIVSAFDTRGWGDDVAVLTRSQLNERQLGKGDLRATGKRLSEMGTRYTPEQIRNGEAKLGEVFIPQGWMKEYVRNARFRANELKYPKETLIYDDPGVISAARKDVAEVRDILGIDPYQKTVVTDKELMAAAKEHNAYEVMSDVQKGKTASASEQQSMAVELQRLRNEMRAAKDADEIDKYRELWEKAGSLADALDQVGAEAGRTMRARRLIVDDAFDTFGLTRAIENAQDGKPLTAKQQVNVENLVKDAETARKELAKAKAELAEAIASGEVSVKSKRGLRFSRQELDDELESLLTEFKSKAAVASSGINPELIPIVGKIALNYAKRGINTIDEIVEAIQGHIPNITRQEVIDAIAMPGEPRTKSDLAKALSELRTEAKRLSTPTQAKKATAAENMAAKKAESQRLAGIKRDRIEAERLEKAGRRAESKALRDDIAARAKGEKKAQRADEALERGNAADLKRKADRVRDVQKKIAEYERRMKEGDYTMPSKDVAVKTKQVEFLEADMARMRKRFESLRESARLNESIPSKVIRTTADTLRGSQLGFDLGAMLRQGMFGVSHPKKMLVSVRNGFNAMRSDQVLQVIENRLAKGEINGKPASAIRSKAGLYMADTLSQPEETFASNLISKLPLLGKVYDAGERFTTGFLNTYRAEMFDWFAKRNPKATEQELKDWARWINSTSGRSNIKDIPRIASILFTSPRYAASRFEVMGRIIASPALIKNPAERQVLIEALKTGGVILGAMKMAEAAGADVNFDYKSSDFLKIRVGDTVYDPTAGISGSARLVLRAMFPAVNGSAPDRGKAVSDEVGRFATGKVSPAIATPYEMRTNKSLTGFDVPEDEKGWNALLPVIVAQARENIKKDGYGKGLLKTAPEIVGIGSNTYPKK